MSVLIKNMDIPKTGCIILAIRADGFVEGLDGTIIGKAIEVKAPHGDLIDRNVLDETVSNFDWGQDSYWDEHASDLVNEAPTVIEAEE